MPQSLSVQSVTYNPDGSISLMCSDGQGREFPNNTALQMAVSQIVTRELLENLLLARFKALDPNMTNPAAINGVGIEVDLANTINPPIAFS
ncbi:unnamed protein product [Gemmata massiliana]|uniref:Uncharacterized protein n=1 Tax=Gemmata massiliana TaxID=1210884 RepID=A0A6P2D468_9BACT|nr:hypothetical protein [Gemmata massiliana]VTR95225.1 unnamed protein product [Gemmata massiliana]